MAAVCMGTPAVEGMVVAALDEPPAPVATTPEVNGTAELLEAPLKAGDVAEAVGLGVAVLLLGLRTL